VAHATEHNIYNSKKLNIVQTNTFSAYIIQEQYELVVLTKRYALDAIELISSYVSSYIIM
jgi:hypothetical protein